jgi:superfamily I DNA/RNA helicase
MQIHLWIKTNDYPSGFPLLVIWRSSFYTTTAMIIQSCHRYLKLRDSTVNTSLKKVYGPPGCGKTTWLIDHMEKSGVPFERIAFVSFSKSTIANAKERLGLNQDQTQYFRTIHGMNFHLLKLKKSQLAHQHLSTFNAKFSTKFLEDETKKTENDDVFKTTSVDTIDDKFYYQMMEDRKRLLPKDYVPPHFKKAAGLYLDFKSRYFEWLQDNDYIDFMGMLEQGIAQEILPPVDLLCVDEWQDLVPLQVQQINFWSQNIPRSVHAGDDDQTIYTWAGANHQDFLQFPTFTPAESKTIILDKTYRLPARVLDMSVSFIRRNKNRVDKDFTPANNTTGIIEYTNIDKVAEILKQQIKQGTCKVLVRNNALKPKVMSDLSNRGIPVNVTLKKIVEAVAFIDQRKTFLTVQDLYFIANSSAFHGTKHFLRGGKKGLKDLADMLAAANEKGIDVDALTQYKVRDILTEAIKNGDFTVLHTKTLAKAIDLYRTYGKDYQPVEISNIHEAKGTEADTVVVCLDVIKRTYVESRAPDKIEEERRVWYVALTRTKKNLIFLEPTYRTSGFYPSPMNDYVKLYLKNYE